MGGIQASTRVLNCPAIPLIKRQSSLSRLFSKKKDVGILMVGLDQAGKTTILYALKLGEIVLPPPGSRCALSAHRVAALFTASHLNPQVTTVPTIGFHVEQLAHSGVAITCWDVGGKDKIRPLWRHY